MRIRSLLIGCTAVAAVVTGLIGTGLVVVTGLAHRDAQQQAESIEVSRGVANLLALTNELAVFGGARAADQWRSRHAQLLSALQQASLRQAVPSRELAEMNAHVAELPVLFQPLATLDPGLPGTLVQRRRELLLERLMTEMQEVVESGHRWTLALGERQQRDQRLYAVLMLAAPLLLLLLLAGLALLVGSRVLGPLARLQAAAGRLQAGDLSARCSSDADDELGDAARAVDAMAMALAASRHHMQAINDNLPAFISHVDSSERYTFANEYFRHLGGIDPASMSGRTMREVRGDEVYARLEPWIRRVLAGEAVHFEFTRNIDGRNKHVQTTYVPDHDGDGTVRGFYAMTFDITRRKQAELRAAAGERRIKAITDNLPALVAHIDAAERYTFVNAHIGRVFNVEPRAMLGRTMRETRGEAIYADIAPHVQRALAGETVSFESSGEADGRLYHYQSNYVPDTDEAGSVQGFYAMTFDISARKQAELQQAAGERWLKAITDSVPALVAYIDRDVRYRFANSRYREWMNADPAAMIGMPVREAISAETYAQVEAPLQAALGGEHRRFERHGTVDGLQRHYLTEYIPDRAADGAVRGVYALSIDMTERKAAEQALAQSERRLFDLLHSLPAMVGYFDMSQRCQFVNDTALNALGLERGALPGLPMRAMLGESSYALYDPYVREVLQGRRARLHASIPFQGREAHFQAHLIPDRVQGGAQRGYYMMTFDITALKEAQHKQVQVEHRLRAITDNLPVLISYLDREERTTFLNATARRWLGREPEHFLGKPLAEVADPQHYQQRSGYIRRALAGERIEFEIESVLRGSTMHLQNVYIPDIQPDGSVAGIFTLSTDVTALKQTQQQLDRLARVDPLTGLPNRRLFEEMLPQATARALRADAPLALIFLDLDEFKSINDRLGHAGGDIVLKEFAQRLKRSVRVTDTPARLAGDEFVILLEGLHAAGEAELVAEKIATAIRDPFMVNGQPLRVTTSMGVAYMRRPPLDSGLMELADAALYEAKDAGRNTWRMRALDEVYPLRA